jgi:hypothetical protein
VARVAVEAENFQAGGGVGGVGDVGGVELASDAVLGAEERNEFYAVGVGEDVYGTAALRIHASLIRDKANTFAAEWRKVLLLEDVNASLRLLGGLHGR